MKPDWKMIRMLYALTWMSEEQTHWVADLWCKCLDLPLDERLQVQDYLKGIVLLSFKERGV